MKSKRARETSQQGRIKVLVKDMATNASLADVKVRLQPKRKVLLTDDTGAASFSRIASGKQELSVVQEGFVFDHLQFHGKHHCHSMFVLQPEETLEIVAYLRPETQEPERPLDKKLDDILEEVSSEMVRKENTLPSDLMNLISGLKRPMNKRQISQLIQEMPAVHRKIGYLFRQIEQVRLEFGQIQKSVIFHQEDAAGLAIRIQERLGLPKFAEQHPKAPEAWAKCLEVSSLLHSNVVRRDILLSQTNRNLGKLKDYRKYLEAMDFVHAITKDLKQVEVQSALLGMKGLLVHVQRLGSLVTKTQDLVAEIESHGSSIDSPSQWHWISEQVSQPFR